MDRNGYSEQSVRSLVIGTTSDIYRCRFSVCPWSNAAITPRGGIVGSVLRFSVFWPMPVIHLKMHPGHGTSGT